MQYTKAMIDLIKEARRCLPVEQKFAIKLADPDLFQSVYEIYNRSQDVAFNAIVEELFRLAGSPWVEKLDNSPVDEPSDVSEALGEGYLRKSYRSVSQMLDRVMESSQEGQERVGKKVYRGQPVNL